MRLVIFLGCLVLYTYHTYSQQKIKVNFINVDLDSVILYYHTFYYPQSKSVLRKIEKTSSVEFTLPAILPQTACMIYNTDTLWIWLNHSNYEITITHYYLTKQYVFGNPDADLINLFFKNFRIMLIKKFIIQKILNTPSIDAFEIFLYELHKMQTEWLHQYKLELSDYAYQYLKKRIDFYYWLALFMYPVEKANHSNDMILSHIPSIMLNNFPKEELKNQNYLFIPEFSELLKYYITYQSLVENKFKKFTDNNTALNFKLTVSRNLLKGEVHAFNYGQFLLDFYPLISKTDRKYLLKNFSELPFGQSYYNFCKDYIQKNPVADTPDNQPDTKQTNEITFNGLDGKQHTLSELKGKVVYVDFWASWCGPCRAMMPLSKKLYESFSEKERKKLVFLYISIDADEQSWKKGLIENMPEGIQWHSPGNWNSKAVKYFKINSIPRYMIINKKGQIVDFNAKRPADPQVADELRKLINE